MSGRFIAAALTAAFLAISAVAQAQADPGTGNGRAGDNQAIPLRPTGPVPGQYIVVLKDDIANPAAAAQGLARAHGLRLGFIYSHALKGFSAQLPERALAALGRDPLVAYIEADQWVQSDALSVPTGIHRIYADTINPDGDLTTLIDGVDDYRVDVDVAVIDTGIDYTHPDLDVVGGTDCSGSSPYKGKCAGNGPNAQFDGNGHGTHVSGTIGALDDGNGVVGVAPGARLYAVKVLKDSGSGWYSGVIAGIDWVTARAETIEVANMSLGGGDSSALCQAIHSSVGAGVTYAVAAGNESDDANNHSPANCDKYYGNDLAGMMTVSALADFDGEPGGNGSPTCRSDVDDTFANFSNYGSRVDVIAPGVCILSTWTGGGTNTISGTSMATPHVTGAAALLASNGSMTPAQIQTTLVANGNLNWNNGDDNDGIKERLLDVSNTSVFRPATVPQAGTPLTPADDPPSVAWFSPTGGAPVSGTTVPVQIDASDKETTDPNGLTVEWRVDSGSWNTATHNGVTGYYEDTWDTTTGTDGNPTLTAQADDGVNAPTTAQVTVTVDNVPDTVPADVASADVDYGTSGGKNSEKHLDVTVTAYDGLDATVAGASISVIITNDTLNASASGAGITGSDGSILFSWKNAPSGHYTTAMTADGTSLDPGSVQDGTVDAGYTKP